MLKFGVVVSVLLLASAAALAYTDDFNRPDGTDMGPNWTEVSGDWRIQSERAHSSVASSTDLMTFNNFSADEPFVQADVFYEGGARTQYAALVSLYSNLSNNLFVKVQDNGGYGYFGRVFFYYGNNGGPWSGMTGGNYYVDVDGFTQARISTVVSGNDITLSIDRDFDGIAEDVLTRGNFPTSSLGTTVGLGGYSDISIDNFLIPEPGTLALLSVGFLALLRRR
jgi:hypothetical protein